MPLTTSYMKTEGMQYPSIGKQFIPFVHMLLYCGNKIGTRMRELQYQTEIMDVEMPMLGVSALMPMCVQLFLSEFPCLHSHPLHLPGSGVNLHGSRMHLWL